LQPSRSADAKKVLIKGLERDIYGLVQRARIMARAYAPLVSTSLVWGDIRDGNTSRSLLPLNDLLSCGVGLVDLIKAHLVTSYDDLKRNFKFNPVDLMIDYPLFNMGHLKQFFNADYTHLVVDFLVGIDDYLNNLKLSLQDIGSAGIDAQTALEWPTHVKSAFASFNRGDPTEKNKMDSRLSSLLRPLDAAMFITRVKHSHDPPEDWVAFLGMTASHLASMGISAANLMELWGSQYGNIQTILKIFSCSNSDYQQLLANGNKQLSVSVLSSSSSPSSRHAIQPTTTTSHTAAQMHQQTIVLPPLMQRPQVQSIPLDSIWYPGRDQERKNAKK
jgi:hypothetical protein